MAKRRGSSARKTRTFEFTHWRELIGVALILLAVVTLLSIIPTRRGAVTESWMAFLWVGLGLGMYLAPFILGALGIAFLLEALGRDLGVDAGKLAALVVFCLLFLTLLGLMSPSEAVQLANWGFIEIGAGGYAGTVLSSLLVSAVGLIGAYVVILLLSFVCLSILLELSPAEIGAGLANAWKVLPDWYRIRFRLASADGSARADELLPAGIDALPLPPEIPVEPRANGHTGGSPVAKPALPVRPQIAATDPQSEFTLQPRIIGGQNDEPSWELPPLEEIFEIGVEHEISQAEIRTRVKIIEDTLASFGVPARVVEVNQGPAVTQFGIEPGFLEQKQSSGHTKRSKVKVSKISALANDLALALAASPVRIEAPVPGRSMVGVEVPNMETSMVTLRSVMETEPFQKLSSKTSLAVALGQDVSGQPAVADLEAMPHLLIAGATGSGKSVCVNAIIACLLCQNTPRELRFIMVDPKMVELNGYNGIPHLSERVVVELERVVEVLKSTTQEMDRRYQMFSKMGARNLQAYNSVATSRGEPTLPKIVVVIDELADLMMVAPEQVERYICRIAQMARATGIHLVIATQRPSVDVITGLIKANFPARISFAVSSQVDSRVILDVVGAERLLGHGDMLFMRPDSSKLARLQGCFVSDAEINRLVRYWKRFRSIAKDVPIDDFSRSMVQRPLLDDLIVAEQQSPDDDPLLDEAIAVVREQSRASASLLQRRLRVGYSRAARLIDLLEERHIVGPDQGGGRSREVIEPDDIPPESEFEFDD